MKNISIAEFKEMIRRKENPRRVSTECEAILINHLEPLFVPECRITLLVRAPHLPDGDLVLTRDDLDKAISALVRAKELGLNIGPGVDESES